MTRYIRIPKFEELTGYTEKAIARKIETNGMDAPFLNRHQSAKVEVLVNHC